jgi:hypothetical protein
MKYNLKTFPRLQGWNDPYLALDLWHAEIESWREGFEAELREQLKNVEELGGSMGEKMLIKELLGE